MTCIEITINAQGEVTVRTFGYAGSSCKAASQQLEEALGVKQTEKLTAEYYQTQTTATHQQLKQ